MPAFTRAAETGKLGAFYLLEDVVPRIPVNLAQEIEFRMRGLKIRFRQGRLR